MTRKVTGRIITRADQKRMEIQLPSDFGAYYRWFILKHYWIYLHPPLHGTHITLTNKKLDNQKDVDWRLAKKYNGWTAEIDYDVNVRMGGFSKDFKNFYLKVEDPYLESLKNRVGIVEKPGYKGAHITIGSTKGGVRDFFKVKL